MFSPNLLFLMIDQMQSRVLGPGNPCQTLRAAARTAIWRRSDRQVQIITNGDRYQVDAVHESERGLRSAKETRNDSRTSRV